MLYLLSLNALFLVALAQCWRLLTLRSQGVALARGESLSATLGLVVAMVLGLPLVMALSSKFDMTPVAGWATLVGGALGLLVYGATLWREGSVQPLRRYVRFAAAAASAYLVFAAVDHLTFFSFGSVEDAGMMNWDAVRAEVKANDVDCETGILLVAGVNQAEASYRCPTIMVLDKYTAMPFAPWPSYVQGRSADLASGIRAMQEEARRSSK